MTDRRPDDRDVQEILRSWAERLCADLDLPADAVDLDAILGLAGVAAHGVVRPAAPLTTYLVGVAVGRAAAEGREGRPAFEAAVETARRAVTEHTGPGASA